VRLFFARHILNFFADGYLQLADLSHIFSFFADGHRQLADLSHILGFLQTSIDDLPMRAIFSIILLPDGRSLPI